MMHLNRSDEIYLGILGMNRHHFNSFTNHFDYLLKICMPEK